MISCNFIGFNQKISYNHVESLQFKKKGQNHFMILVDHISSLYLLEDNHIEIIKKEGNSNINLKFHISNGILKVLKNHIEIISFDPIKILQ